MASRPDVLLDEDALTQFREGFAEMSELAAVTYGPLGGFVGQHSELRNEVELLTDAATIARRIIQLPGEARDMGAMLARHLIWTIRQEVGDGSALTAIIANSLIREGTRLIAAGHNPQILRRGVERAVEAVSQSLMEMAEPLESEEQYVALATSLVEDPELGRILGEIVDLVGPDGAVTIEEFTAPYLEREYVEGARLPWGMVSPYFETDEVRHEVVLEQPYVYVTNNELRTPSDVLPILNKVQKAGGKSLLVIAHQTLADALATLVVNSRKGKVKSAAIKVEALGENRVPSMEDVAILTGGRIVLADQGLGAQDVRIEDLGRARRAVVRRKETIIAGGAGSSATIRQRVRTIREQLRSLTPADDAFKPLRDRLSTLSSGVAILKIGAFGSRERKEIRERVENALLVMSACAADGMVPGGGAALLACIPRLKRLQAKGDEKAGILMVMHALEAPMSRLAESAGHHAPLVINAAVRRGSDHGFDVMAEKVVNMRKAAISDPVRVVRSALEAAASAAMMTLTIEALVLHKKPDTAMEP